MKIKTSDLSGVALDWAVCVCEGRKEPELMGNFFTSWYTWLSCRYSTSWCLTGPIIEREKIAIDYSEFGNEWCASAYHTDTAVYAASKPLVAAMRCYVASKLGDTVDIPDELHRSL